MSQESVVQVAPDSTGKRIRNLQLDVLQPDGTTVAVQMQVTVQAGKDGDLVATEVVRGSSQLTTTDTRVLEQLTTMNDTLKKVLDMLALEFEQSTEDFDGQD